MSEKKGKEFIFPDNVESGYNLIKGVTVKGFFTVFLPFLLVGIIIVSIPPYSMVFVLIRVFVAFIIATVGLAITVARPVKSRRNITVVQYMKHVQSYNRRQKLFYIEPKRKRRW
ncbi:hypothetical protein [Bacillus inaquosorum]|uniref:hypothetical protein n=1 Tax=Bacillus inaquosorum TaxID=483913 RepID=UPI0005166CFA|nr:hypothetical protein [Bacillus inaquosorum]